VARPSCKALRNFVGVGTEPHNHMPIAVRLSPTGTPWGARCRRLAAKRATTEESGGQREHGEQHHADRALANRKARCVHVALNRAAEDAVEPREGPAFCCP
jgi:hypothetical protein